MKRNIQVTICAAVTGLGVCAFAPSTWAQAGSSSSASTQSGNKLGKVERANKITGRTVTSSDNQKVGEIENIVVDLESGHILYVVVDAENKVAVPPQILGEATGKNIRATVEKAKFDNAPQYTRDIDKPESMGQASFVNQVYQHFGQTAWWQRSGSASTGTFNNVHKASDLDGMNVQNQNNQKIGEVNNIVLDLPAGRVAYVILEPGSDLKLGKNLYALPPNAFGWNANQKALVANLSREQLAAAPHFTNDNWAGLSNPAFASKVYQYYGKQAWFQGGGMQPTGR